MRSFASDNNSGVHPLIMDALAKANTDHAVGYGDDPWTTEAVEKIREAFTPDCDVYFVFNGTGSNVMALQSITRPFNSILCADTAHIAVDECGAPAKMTGCQICTIHTTDGKLTPNLSNLIFMVSAISIIHNPEPYIYPSVRNLVLSILPKKSKPSHH